MKKSFDNKMCSIPPYISTKWQNISSMALNGDFLVITLNTGEKVTIPGLTQDEIEEIFAYHQKAVAQEDDFIGASSAFKISISGLEEMAGNVLRHNPDHVNMPELPPEVIDKVEALGDMLPTAEFAELEPPVERCNCFYCQVVRHLGHEDHPTLEEEDIKAVPETELHFEEWFIEEVGDKLYKVVSKLNPDEEYQVYLGSPIGCTCGQPDCDHLKAVLRS